MNPGTLDSGSGRSLMSSPRICGLLHVRTHVARIDPVHAQVAALGGEDRRQLLECRLARAIATPARIRVHCGVARDVDDARAGLEHVLQLLDHCERREHVRQEHLDQRLERIVEQRRLRARSERAGVVDDGVEPGVPAREHGERLAVFRIDDVAGDRGNVRHACELVAYGAEAVGVSRGENEIPAARSEPAREREPEPA